MKVEEKQSVVTASKQDAVQKQQQPQQQPQMQIRKSSVWSREKINQLIELYKKHECLWNHWHEAYKSKDKRNRAIEDICAKLQVPKFEFGKKIHNLRNQFNTEMKKLEQRIEEAGVSLDDANAMDLRCKWSHFESLMFLRHVIEPRPGGYQTAFQPPKKMRLKFDFNTSEDDINVTTVTIPSSGSSGSNNTSNAEELQYQYDDNVSEEVITDDFQNFENEIVELEQSNCREEVHDQKYQPPSQSSQNQDLSSISARNLRSSNNKKNSPNLLQNSSANSSSQTEVININEDSSIIELNSNNLSVVPSHTHIISSVSTSSPTGTTPISSSSSSNRPASVLRDQWDAFGELVANEFRNLNSDVSRKRLKRKIMQAMLEVGEEDDNLASNRLRNN
ncbi:uncharacterized protein ACRADG_010266 [Cochliomyia hominivorax]